MNTEFSMCRGRQRCQGSLIDSGYNLSTNCSILSFCPCQALKVTKIRQNKLSKQELEQALNQESSLLQQIAKLNKAEQERIRKIEEERKRKEAEEKKRQEEEEKRRLQEEEDKKARAEMERVRKAEEAKRLKEEEQRAALEKQMVRKTSKSILSHEP